MLSAPGSGVVAVCDVNSKRLAEVRELAGGERVRAYHDYRQLLANKDVDAVLIATNVHWHVLCTIHACQAGKDVYVEKPLCHFSGEGRFAIAAAKKYDRIVQIGTNQHSCAHYRKAVEIIQSGRLGNIMEVKVWDTEHYGSLGPRPPDRDPPPELDWDFYVGPSPLRPYNPCYHAFDWFKDFGGGFQVAWGVHHYDIVHWAMGVHWPKTVMANGGNYAGFHDCREWPDTFSAIVEYGPGRWQDGLLLQYSARAANRYLRRSHSKSFHGARGTLWVDRSRYTIVGETQSGRLVDNEGAAMEVGQKLIPDEEVRAGNDIYHHTEVFLDNVRNHRKPEADVNPLHAHVGHL